MQDFSCACVSIGYIDHMTNKLAAKLSTMSIDQIIEVVTLMFNNMSDEAEIILEHGLAALESKMAEADFVKFCDKLSA